MEKKSEYTEVYYLVYLLASCWDFSPGLFYFYRPLPHGIRPDTKGVCLFTKDESNSTSEQTESFYKQLLKNKGITSITEVMPYTRLKRQYKTYKTMRRLVSAFDLFLADERITRILLTHLGKLFCRRKKVPIPVDLTTQDLSEHINRIVQGTTLTVTNHGSLNTARVGHTGMSVDHLVENIFAAVDVLSEKLPEVLCFGCTNSYVLRGYSLDGILFCIFLYLQKWESVKYLHLKTEKSLSLPIFSSCVSFLGSPQKSKEENQGNKIATNSLQVSVRPERECARDGHELEAEKESIAEPDKEDKIPQLVPVQAAFSQKYPELHKATLIKDSTEESINAETSQAKTPDEKRKASMALGTPEEINKNCTELNKTPDSGKHKKPRIDA
ncbi:ribosomal L1 domain-containing protein 1-like isoform X3 [Antechinus flavipes]|uniref:ribosomal L1 domain-containing protein 1-like isoform X3 n=1 Tax=Antechinus flavipes TaxID=38775 RepID=UPI002235D822|nr:ribosomal L1 domain-containing protein 1-like isoform X3 [Antechinus flavipes]